MGESRNSYLLSHILLKLSPDVFFHPLWIHCFPKSAADSVEVIDQLQSPIQRLIESGDYRSAAQLLLACAVLQKRYGNPSSSMGTAQKVWNLGVSQEIPEIARWADWGACAICAELGEFCKAAEYIERLEGFTDTSEDWILSATLEIVKNILLEQQREKDGMQEILTWMSGWGEPFYVISLYPASYQSLKPDEANRFALRALPRFSRAWWTALIKIVIRFFTGKQLLRIDSEGRASLPVGSAAPEIIASLPSPGFETGPGNQLLVPVMPSAHDNQEQQASLNIPSPESNVQEVRPDKGRNGSGLSLKVYCLGTFRLYQNEQWIYRWVSRKALSVLKYLVVHYPTPVSKDLLMDSLWPDADTESARRNLHQAIYTLRQILKESAPEFQHVLFEKEQYFLNPQMEIWLDFVEFEGNYQRGKQMEKLERLNEAIQAYVAADELYRGDFMGDDLYEDLPIARRQYFWEMYLSNAYRLSNLYLELGQTRAAIAVNQRVLAKDKTQETAYQNLMKCYIHHGQRNLAIRQYQRCVQILKEELDIPPSVETRSLYQEIIQM